MLGFAEKIPEIPLFLCDKKNCFSFFRIFRKNLVKNFRISFNTFIQNKIQKCFTGDFNEKKFLLDFFRKK